MYDQMILDNEKLVYYIINSRFKGNTDLYDLGLIGLIKGVKSFDPTKGYNLSTYLTKCITNEILMTFRKRNPLNYDYKSLDECWDNGVSLEDVIPDDQPELIDKLINEDNLTKMYCLINNLDDRDKFIVCSMYGVNGYKKITQWDIAKQLNVHQTYVSRLCKKILKKLRGGFNENIYKD